jgi:hypothetical protein
MSPLYLHETDYLAWSAQIRVVILRADISEMQGGDDRFVPRTKPLRTIKGEGARAGKFPAKNLGAVAREIWLDACLSAVSLF